MANPFTGAAALGDAASIVQLIQFSFHVLHLVQEFVVNRIELPDTLQFALERLQPMEKMLETMSNHSDWEKNSKCF